MQQQTQAARQRRKRRRRVVDRVLDSTHNLASPLMTSQRAAKAALLFKNKQPISVGV
jgi:hypothetical protein